MKLTLDYLKECFEYSEESPSGLIWKERPREHFNSERGWKIFNVRFSGKTAGSIGSDKKGRKRWAVWPDRVFIGNHTIVYMFFNVCVKDGLEIDHIDGNSLNNKKDNLRLASKSQNMMNAKKRSDNSTGYKGVHKHHAAYRAKIQIKGKAVYLGRFGDPEEAYAAYCKAAKEHYGEFFRAS